MHVAATRSLMSVSPGANHHSDAFLSVSSYRPVSQLMLSHHKFHFTRGFKAKPVLVH